jgi:tetratricopeptide (TPR) repeat protein
LSEKKYNEALICYKKSLKIREEINDNQGLTNAFINLSALSIETKKYDEALTYALKSMEISKTIKYPENIRESAHKLYTIYKTKKDYQKAVQNYELFIQMRDSINNESNRKASIKSQLKYEYEKQAAADSVAHAKESEIKNAEIAKQTAEIKAKKNQQYALFGGLGLVMIFAGFMYNRFKVTQKQKGIIESQKEIVEEQKHLVEEKQKEILDSIHYARRIQMAQLPSEKRVSFILSKLKK